MSDEQINNEAAFARALDLNPDVIVKGSMTIEMRGAHALLGFQVKMPVSHQRLAAAMMAAAGEMPPEEPQEAPKKAPARRAPAKKAAAKKP